MFPSARFDCLSDLTPDLPAKFEEVLSVGREGGIQQFLTENPYLVQYAIDQSGHHGIWLFPKQMISSCMDGPCVARLIVRILRCSGPVRSCMRPIRAALFHDRWL